MESILTGITEFDEIYGGIEKRKLTVIFGRAGCGKSTFAMCLAKKLVTEQDIPIAYFSAETAIKMAMRIIELSGIIDPYLIKLLGSAPLFLQDIRDVDDISDLKSKIHYLVNVHGVEFIILDLDILMVKSKIYHDIVDLINAIISDTGITIVVTMQFNRSTVDDLIHQGSINVALLDYPNSRDNEVYNFNFINNFKH